MSVWDYIQYVTVLVAGMIGAAVVTLWVIGVDITAERVATLATLGIFGGAVLRLCRVRRNYVRSR